MTQTITLKDEISPTLSGDFTDVSIVASERPWPQTVTTSDKDPCYDDVALPIVYSEEEQEGCATTTSSKHWIKRSWVAQDVSSNNVQEPRAFAKRKHRTSRESDGRR
mmetsp:Transcript_15958/g.29641  ORF Transcript_15958/g.29641 Transcript_15958/m.29641 type:complete len:107 (-) Transcript_15958:296-616(-)